MIDVTSLISGKRKQTSSGWISFNAPCCIHRGENQDKRMRGGMKSNAEGFSFHCFNCGFTASFTLGRSLSFKARQLLTWMGADTIDIEQLNLESLRHKSINGLIEDTKFQLKPKTIEFTEKYLPANLELINTSPEHQVYREYLANRNINYQSYPYMVSPNETGRNANRIVIPFTHNNMIVGNCARFLDDRTPKYINDIQHGYVFGTDLQKPDWQFAILTEGVFDALAIDGLAVLHNDINSAQRDLIKTLNREIIVVPDRDKAGLKLVDRAIEYGYSVSFPDWADDIKDVNDAVVRYGKLGTLLTIMAARETGKIRIELRKKTHERRIRIQS